MDVIQKGILTLIKSAVTGETLPLPDGFSLKEALPVIEAHRVISLAHTGAVNCGFSVTDPAMQKLLFFSGKLMLLSEKQMRAANEVFEKFTENEIDYMPVKGYVMKAYYPSPELRYMGDADVLIRHSQYDKIKPIMEESGFELDEECDHVFAWDSKNLTLELHVKLIPESEKKLYDYFRDGWHLAKYKDGSHYSMCEEDQFLFVFTHFVKHYRDGGIGCRQVVDMWVLDRCFNDESRAYIRKELKKMNLDRFYDNMKNVIKNWFEDGSCDEITELITQFIFGNGNWGTAENHALTREVRKAETDDPKKMKKQSLIKDIFPPAERIKGEYPILKKVPTVLPFVWIIRLFRTVLFRWESVRRSVQKASLLDEKKISEYQSHLEIVGLEMK